MLHRNPSCLLCPIEDLELFYALQTTQRSSKPYRRPRGPLCSIGDLDLKVFYVLCFTTFKILASSTKNIINQLYPDNHLYSFKKYSALNLQQIIGKALEVKLNKIPLQIVVVAVVTLINRWKVTFMGVLFLLCICSSRTMTAIT